MDISEPEIEWDDTPEQLQLTGTQTHSLPQTRHQGQTSTHTEDQDVRTDKTLQSKPQLQRSNAMRKRKENNNNTSSRTELQRRPRQVSTHAISKPRSPSEVDTNVVQNLNTILRRNTPLDPTDVQMGPTVQNMDRVLQSMEQPHAVRRSARIRLHAEREDTDNTVFQEKGPRRR